MEQRRSTWRLGCAAVAGLIAASALLSACSETQFLVHTAKRMGRAEHPSGDGGRYKVGNAYQINGTWYYPAEDYDYAETGIASWYGPNFHNGRTANGEVFDMNRVSAAHRTLPLPSIVRVTNLGNGRSLIVRVNDRGPFAHGRIIDLSRRAAQLLGFQQQGTARVRVEIMAEESRVLAARLRGGTSVASADTPITVDKLPKAAVDSEALPPPPGAQVARAVPPPEPLPAPPSAPARPLAVDPAVDPGGNPAPVVTSGVAVPTQLYVQAGAFTQYVNANRVRARLAALGRVGISQVLIDGRDFFRVRLGPLASVEEADMHLEKVLNSGYPDAKIIVE
ncbi:MAG: septal ring lytic transglycosylase RlpA family protein [Hyphomicrobiales bacterium]|nr:septal ring lytic transglycosylase RlpA family protein [Hyphomicrobiales bacterium]